MGGDCTDPLRRGRAADVRRQPGLQAGIADRAAERLNALQAIGGLLGRKLGGFARFYRPQAFVQVVLVSYGRAFKTSVAAKVRRATSCALGTSRLSVAFALFNSHSST